jgi:hypothetical protein
MFWQHKRPGLKDKDASASRGIVEEQLLCDDRAKRAAANDDRIEFALAPANSPGCAIQRFLQRIAEKAPHIVEGE